MRAATPGRFLWIHTAQPEIGIPSLSRGQRSDSSPWTILGFNPRISSSIQLSLQKDQPIISGQESGDFLCLLDIQEKGTGNRHDRSSYTLCISFMYRNMNWNRKYTWQSFREFCVAFTELVMILLSRVYNFWNEFTQQLGKIRDILLFFRIKNATRGSTYLPVGAN